MNKFIQFFHLGFSFRPALYSYKTTVKKNILVQNYKVEKARTNEKIVLGEFLVERKKCINFEVESIEYSETFVTIPS